MQAAATSPRTSGDDAVKLLLLKMRGRVEKVQTAEKESMPRSTVLKSEFGDYSISFTVQGNILQMIRKYTRNKTTLPAEKYGEAQKFFETIRRADNSRIVFVKKES